MSNDSNVHTTISVDIKRNRVRILKSTYHLIGEPKYIQFLVNPEKRLVAFRGVENYISGGMVNEINIERMNSSKSYEIYSCYFIRELINLSPELSKFSSYRLAGEIVSSEKTAVFSLDKIEPIGEKVIK